MKLSELDELRADVAALAVLRFRCAEQLMRILAEREMLLEALRRVVGQLDGMREFVVPDGGAESLVVAREAIRKAES